MQGIKSMLSTRSLPVDDFLLPACKASYDKVEPAQTLVLVTGAAGMLGAHVCRELLNKGYRVRGVVRDAKQKVRAKNMRRSPFFPQEGTLKYFEADLNLPSSAAGLQEALTGVDFVIHTAIPSSWTSAKELLEACVGGVQTLLSAALAAKVKRVVMTSSLSTCFDLPDSAVTYTDTDWNKESTLKLNPMAFAKTSQEKAAWNFVRANPQLDLVCLAPCTIIGPLLAPKVPSNPVFDVVTMEFPIILDFWWVMADARDVARAHIAAIENPQANGRYLLAPPEPVSMEQVVACFAESFPLYKRPVAAASSKGTTAKLTGVGAHLLSFTKPGHVGHEMRSALSKKTRVEGKRSREELGFACRELATSLGDAVRTYVYWGFIADHRLSEEILQELKGEEAVHALAVAMASSDAVQSKDRKSLMGKIEPRCWVGEDAVQYLLKRKDLVRHRSKAERILEVMFEMNLFVDVQEKKKLELGTNWYRWAEPIYMEAIKQTENK